jgi:hypothetical protein
VEELGTATPVLRQETDQLGGRFGEPLVVEPTTLVEQAGDPVHGCQDHFVVALEAVDFLCCLGRGVVEQLVEQAAFTLREIHVLGEGAAERGQRTVEEVRALG